MRREVFAKVGFMVQVVGSRFSGDGSRLKGFGRRYREGRLEVVATLEFRVQDGGFGDQGSALRFEG